MTSSNFSFCYFRTFFLWNCCYRQYDNFSPIIDQLAPLGSAILLLEQPKFLMKATIGIATIAVPNNPKAPVNLSINQSMPLRAFITTPIESDWNRFWKIPVAVSFRELSLYSRLSSMIPISFIALPALSFIVLRESSTALKLFSIAATI